MHKTSTAMGKIKRYLILLIIFLSFSDIYSQSEWFQIPSPTSNSLYFIFPINNDTIFLGSTNGKIYKTINGGSNWQSITVVNGNFMMGNICFTSQNTGFIQSYLNGGLFKTTNFGENWSSINIPLQSTLQDISFPSSNIGYLANHINVLKTTNGGINWIQAGEFENNSKVYSIFFLNELTGFAGGGIETSIAKIWKTTNGGNNWQSVLTSDPVRNILNFSFIGSDTGFASGQSGYITKTIDGGDNWNPIYTDHFTVSLGSIYAVSNTKIFTCGDRGLFRSINGGLNWNSVNVPEATYYQVHFLNSLTGFVISQLGKIFKTTSGGDPVNIQLTSEKLPDYFSLSQNYPNPFNPQTKIRFSIPIYSKPGLVNIKIYDIVGKEIARLVNETLSNGEYEVTFNGNNLPSGIYFYSLNIDGEFIDSKKMMLIK